MSCMNEGLVHESLEALGNGPGKLSGFKVLTTRILTGSDQVMSAWGRWGSHDWRIISVSPKPGEGDRAYQYFQLSGGLQREKVIAILKTEVTAKLAEELRTFLLIDCVHAL